MDDYTFLTKAGHVGVAYRLGATDYECLDQHQRRDVVHRFESAVRLLDKHYRVYQYLCKRRIEPIHTRAATHPLVNEALQCRAEHLNARRRELYDIDLYLVLLYEGLTPRWKTSTHLRGVLRSPRTALREWLSSASVLRVIDADLDAAVVRLRHDATAFAVQLADVLRPQRLEKSDTFQFFRRLLNYTDAPQAPASLRYDTHLDYFVADCAVECHRTHLDVNSARVKVLTMKEPPSHQHLSAPVGGALRGSRRVHRVPRVAPYPERAYPARYP